MDIEFHYWMTGIIAHYAGFSEEEAAVIAYSSQYVDDNDADVKVMAPSSHKPYANAMTQTMNILKPREELMRIYPIFHFIPGDPTAPSARRRDGKMHVLNTTPNNKRALALLRDAFQSGERTRLYRIGIATHAYSDTWAHQNFVGWHEVFNAIGINARPNIGHADAGNHPDWAGHRWTDPRLLVPEVNNNHRFLSCAKALLLSYGNALGRERRRRRGMPAQWPVLEKSLVEAMGSVTSGDEPYYREKRLARYRRFAPWLPEYDENQWFDEAIDTRVIGLKDSTDGVLSGFTLFKDEYTWRDERRKTKTHWYRFQQAVKEHEQAGFRILSPIFDQLGVDLREV